MKKFLIQIFIIVFIILFIGATVFSIYKFEVFNPISSCFGMLQILFTDKEYTVVQRIPYKVVLAKTGKAFEEYINTQGYYEVKEEQMGSNHIYSNGEKREKVYTRINGYYMIGVWKDTYEQ